MDNIENWLNTIQCMDCLKGLKRIPDKSIDLIIADPPYGISRELNCKGKRLGTTAKLDFNFGEWDKFNKKWFEIAIKKTRGWIISFCAKKDLGIFWNILEKNGFVAVDAIVWQKPDPLPLNAKTRFLNAWETAIVGKRKGIYWGGFAVHNIFNFQAPKGKDRIHPTQKPLELFERLIGLTTKKSDLVLDPFMGSGTTAVACIKLDRQFIGFEISPKYCKLARERIKKIPKPLF